MPKALTSMELAALKPPTNARREVPCGPPAGLYAIVYPSGRKSFALRYRFNRRPRKLTFEGVFPHVPLAKARAQAQRALDKVKDGIDPAMEKAEGEHPRAPDSFARVVQEFIERYAKQKRSWKETERILTREAVGIWGKRGVKQIEHADVLRLLDSIVDRDAPYMANRTYAALSKLFNWCVARRYIEVSPMSGMERPAGEESRDRVLDAKELAALWQAAGECGYPYAPHVRMLILTAQRLNEVARVRWEHLDLTAALWTLPKEETKAKRIHDVPLSPAAVKLLKALPRFTAGDYVFSTTSGAKPINGFSKAKAALDAKLKLKPWRLHDLRRTAVTWMGKSGVPPHVLSAILNHSPGRIEGITAVYNRQRYLRERREALEHWSEYVIALTKAKKAAVA